MRWEGGQGRVGGEPGHVEGPLEHCVIPVCAFHRLWSAPGSRLQVGGKVGFSVGDLPSEID